MKEIPIDFGPVMQESIKNSDLPTLVRLYVEVFAAPPWNEVAKCPSCSKFYGPELQKASLSPCCLVPLSAAYPEQKTIEYILGEFSKPQAQTRFIDSIQGELVGFAWGYQIQNIHVLAQKKWPQSEETQNNVIQAITQYVNPNSQLYYISEVGILPSFRGNKRGTQLTQSLLEYGISQEMPVVFRTNWASPMMRIATNLEMMQMMGPKIKVADGQITKTEETANFIDKINPERTLFIKLP